MSSPLSATAKAAIMAAAAADANTSTINGRVASKRSMSDSLDAVNAAMPIKKPKVQRKPVVQKTLFMPGC
jgi:hypothetical protein